MKHIYRKYLGLLLAILFPATLLTAQVIKHDRLLSFEEDKVASYITTKDSKVAISDKHFKDGKQSLQWNFQANGELSIAKDLKFEYKDPTGADTYLSTFVVWVYNGKPVDDTIEFEFWKDGEKCSNFPMNINYKGWRVAYISYERDMEGTPEEGMNEIRIKAPNTDGELYIDNLLTAAKSDHRHHTPDIHVPIVNKETKSHWLVLYHFSQVKPDIALEATVSNEQKTQMASIETRLRELIYTPSKLKKGQVEKIQKDVEVYTIKRDGDNISGRPLFFGRASEPFERIEDKWNADVYYTNNMEYRKYFDLMQRTAVAYNDAESGKDKEILEKIFIDMYDHAEDQGIAYGSGLGNATHYGYSFRGFFTSYFLMKDVLLKNGRLDAAAKALQWFAIINETYINSERPGIDMDAFNTIATGRISSVMIMQDTPEKVQYLKSFSRWIGNGCLPSIGLDGSFKPDGGAFHHRNNYPAYATGGLSGATDMIYLLNNTNFAVSELGHQTVKNVLMTMRFYCNKTHFPLSMSGRHPNGKGELVTMHYARLALAGSPDRKDKIDKDLASAFLRLVDLNDNEDKPEYIPTFKSSQLEKVMSSFVAEGVKAENNPEGNLALGYGSVSVQRRNNWAAVVRGHSRYLWAAEHYRGANLYGRYMAHGSMQILTGDESEIITPKTSGWVEEGFDWGRMPGATAIHLPVEQLKANVLNVDTYSGFEEMLFSDEAFAGGLSMNKTNGNYGMVLHEHDKYNGSHRARKSYHFFDRRIVALGSDIENINKDYNTETTVFQLAITDANGAKYWNDSKKNDNYYIDHLGTGYYLPKAMKSKVVFERNEKQHSRYQNNGKENSGDWVNLVVNHGKAPKGESYEYMVAPQVKENEMKAYAKKAPYQVLQHDRNGHIVKDVASKTLSYVLFEKPTSLPKGLVEKVDASCLIMLTEDKKEVKLTVANPDLALYTGAADEIYGEDGKRIERSIYSRPWIFNESQEMPVTVTIKGEWNLEDNDKCKIISKDKNATTIQFNCKDGMSIDSILRK